MTIGPARKAFQPKAWGRRAAAHPGRQMVESGHRQRTSTDVAVDSDSETNWPDLLIEIDVPCHPGTKVGQYVPFYYCPRSIMLYILYKGNHADISYREGQSGQSPIIHLQADLNACVRWANSNKVPWALSPFQRWCTIHEFLQYGRGFPTNRLAGCGESRLSQPNGQGRKTGGVSALKLVSVGACGTHWRL